MEVQTVQSSAVSRACLQGFTSLCDSLGRLSAAHRFSKQISLADTEDEFGRFRVWAGNIGALQFGHSSLEYRLQEASLVLQNVLKLLSELKTVLQEIAVVVSGGRLPYDEQVDADELDDDLELETDPDEAPRTELEQNSLSVVDIIDNLYKLSIYIRNPAARSRFSKASSYKAIDPESGIDLLARYQEFDIEHVRHAFQDLRRNFPPEVRYQENELVDRLGRGISRRRQQFMYWGRHRDKLAAKLLPKPESVESYKVGASHTNNGFAAEEPDPEMKQPGVDAARSEITKSAFTATTATLFVHHDKPDDVQSMISSATTARGFNNEKAFLPPPPKVPSGKDFECPYCFTICPAKYLSERNWRAHLLKDLQPYICTYSSCEIGSQLYSSRQEWISHELHTHRKTWRCPAHPKSEYGSQMDYFEHLKQEHGQDEGASNLQIMLEMGETTSSDGSRTCPLCLTKETSGDRFYNHMAFHLESLASFALPKRDSASEEDSTSVRSTSNDALGGSRGSESLGSMSAFSDHPGSAHYAEIGRGPPSPDLELLDYPIEPGDIGNDLSQDHPENKQSIITAEYAGVGETLRPLFDYAPATEEREVVAGEASSYRPGNTAARKAYIDLRLMLSDAVAQEFVKLCSSIADFDVLVEKTKKAYEVHYNEEILKWLNSILRYGFDYAQLLDHVAEHDLEYASLAWAAIAFVLSGIANHVSHLEQFSKAFCEIGNVLPRIEPAPSMCEANVMEELLRTYARILSFLQRAISWYRSSSAQRIVPVASSRLLEYKDIIHEIQFSSDLVHVAINTTTHAENRDTSTSIDKVDSVTVQMDSGSSSEPSSQITQDTEGLVQSGLEPLKTRPSFGPDHDFQEEEIKNVGSPMLPEDSEEATDDNLFAKPREDPDLRDPNKHVTEDFTDKFRRPPRVGASRVAFSSNENIVHPDQRQEYSKRVIGDPGSPPAKSLRRQSSLDTFDRKSTGRLEDSDDAHSNEGHEEGGEGHAGGSIQVEIRSHHRPTFEPQTHYMPHLEEPFVNAVRQGDTAAGKRILENDILPRRPDYDLTEAITYAIETEDVSMADMLLKIGEQNRQKWRLSRGLLSAASKDNEDLVRLLLREGVNPNIRRDRDGSTPLHLAVYYGHDNIVEILIKALNDNGGGSTGEKKDVNGMTPLHIAAQRGRYRAVELLITQGHQKVDARSNLGRTPLIEAACKGNKLTLQYLLSCNADVNIADKTGLTALHEAAINGHIGIAEMLLAAGASVMSRTQSGATPLHFAVRSSQTTMSEMLIKRGADIEAYDNIGPTLLTRRGADLNRSSVESGTPLQAACSRGYYDIVKLLVQEGADLTARGTNNKTCVGIAVDKGDVAMLEILVHELREKLGWEHLHTIDAEKELATLKAEVDIEALTTQASGDRATEQELGTESNIHDRDFDSRSIGRSLESSSPGRLKPKSASGLQLDHGVEDTSARTNLEEDFEKDLRSVPKSRSPGKGRSGSSSPLRRRESRRGYDSDESSGRSMSPLRGGSIDDDFEAIHDDSRTARSRIESRTKVSDKDRGNEHVSEAPIEDSDFDALDENGSSNEDDELLEAMMDVTDRDFILRIERRLRAFVLGPDQSLDLPWGTTHHQQLIGKLADRCGLLYFKFDTSKVLVAKGASTKCPTPLFQMYESRMKDILEKAPTQLQGLTDAPTPTAAEPEKRIKGILKAPKDTFPEKTPSNDLCDHCHETKTNLSYCLPCDVIYCADCWDLQRPHVIKIPLAGGVPHEKIDLDLSRKLTMVPQRTTTAIEGPALKQAVKKEIPSTARWTKIARQLVNPAALEEAGERYEEREDHVIVLRVLTKEEIEQFARRTQEIRGLRVYETARDTRRSIGENASPSSTPNKIADAEHKQSPESDQSGQHSPRGRANSTALMRGVPDHDMFGEAVAIRSFTAPENDELFEMTLRKGQVVEVLERSSDRADWLVVHDQKYTRGIVPEDCVLLTRLLSDEQRRNSASDESSPTWIPNGPREELEDLVQRYHTNLLPRCFQFISNPPEDFIPREKEYRRLTETILSTVLLKADEVLTEGDEVAKRERIDLVHEAQAMLGELDRTFKQEQALYLTLKEAKPREKGIGGPSPWSDRFQRSGYDLSLLAQAIQGEKGIPILHRRSHGRLHYSCFTGTDLTTWLLQNFHDVSNRDEAVGLGSELMTKGLFQHVESKSGFRDGNFFYQIGTDYWLPREGQGSWSTGDSYKSSQGASNVPSSSRPRSPVIDLASRNVEGSQDIGYRAKSDNEIEDEIHNLEVELRLLKRRQKLDRDMLDMYFPTLAEAETDVEEDSGGLEDQDGAVIPLSNRSSGSSNRPRRPFPYTDTGLPAIKQARNTAPARKSRARKLERVQQLQEEAEFLKSQLDDFEKDQQRLISRE